MERDLDWGVKGQWSHGEDVTQYLELEKIMTLFLHTVEPRTYSTAQALLAAATERGYTMKEHKWRKAATRCV